MLETTISTLDKEQIDSISQSIEKLTAGLERVIKGKKVFLENLLTAYLAGGHVLVEDFPGLGKTTVAKTLAALISDGGTRKKTSSFKRIQFTPDLLPYDITGVEVFNPDTRKFKFAPGPIFAQVVLADEINRAGPKVQSALLEVMAEHQVTVGNKSYPMDDLFFVMATQNPLEIEGTYLLPLAQMDRFIMRLSLGYPDLEAELDILSSNPSERELPQLKPVVTRDELSELRGAVSAVYCSPDLMEASARAAAISRTHRSLHLGVSPRGVLHLLQASRAKALVQGRNYVIDQDLLDLCDSVWTHRMRGDDKKGLSPRDLILEGLKQVSSSAVN